MESETKRTGRAALRAAGSKAVRPDRVRLTMRLGVGACGVDVPASVQARQRICTRERGGRQLDATPADCEDLALSGEIRPRACTWASTSTPSSNREAGRRQPTSIRSPCLAPQSRSDAPCSLAVFARGLVQSRQTSRCTATPTGRRVTSDGSRETTLSSLVLVNRHPHRRARARARPALRRVRVPSSRGPSSPTLRRRTAGRRGRGPRPCRTTCTSCRRSRAPRGRGGGRR